VKGFLLGYIANWWGTGSLESNRPYVTSLNANGKACGLDANFLRTALGQASPTGATLPAWVDDYNWSKIIATLGTTAAFIQSTGTRGIALDTGKYAVSPWNPIVAPNAGTSLSTLRAQAYQRGRAIGQALTTAFPNIEILLLGEGASNWFNDGNVDYQLWIDFYDGLASVHPAGGITVMAEQTYPMDATVAGDTNLLQTRYTAIQAAMANNAADKTYWQSSGSVAIGMWPLGMTYSDKSARYASTTFQAQVAKAAQLSTRYIWFYDHGSAWYQLTQADVTKYSAGGRLLWSPTDQMRPTTANIQDYYAVVKSLGATATATFTCPNNGTSGVVNVAAAWADGGYAYAVDQNFGTPGDTNTSLTSSILTLYENGAALGPAHSLHADIRQYGLGRFSHWGNQLYWSASDNSNPMTNGRKYTYCR
jgi:hypothetical protein